MVDRARAPLRHAPGEPVELGALLAEFADAGVRAPATATTS
jgi:hypothetical protein